MIEVVKKSRVDLTRASSMILEAIMIIWVRLSLVAALNFFFPNYSLNAEAGRTGHTIANDQGNRITPSWVAFTDTERLIGEAAKNQASLNLDRTVFDVKRLISRKFDDPVIQNVALTYKVVNREGKPYIQVKLKDGVKVFSPEEISAMILQKMKETAESYLGKSRSEICFVSR